MKGTPAIYLGRIVDKNNFRVVVYGADGSKKLVKSWDEFEAAMQSGLWFATVEDVKEFVTPADKEIEESVANESLKPSVKEKGKSKTKPKSKANSSKIFEPAQKAESIPDDGMGFEVKDDEF